MAVRNNLKAQMDWLDKSKGNVPKRANPLANITVALRNITITSTAAAKDLPPTRTNEPPIASRPTEPQVPAGLNIESLVGNVDRSNRNSGLRLAKRDSGGLRSDSSRVQESPSPEPPRQTIARPTVRPPVDRTPVPAVIDLTFDEPVVTPSTKKRTKAAPDGSAKRQKTLPLSANNKPHTKTSNPDLDMLENDDDDDFNEINDSYDDDDASELNDVFNNYDFNKRSSSNLASASASRATSMTAMTTNSRHEPQQQIASPQVMDLQKRYIAICERRIAMLVERVSIETSTALSEDAKRQKRIELGGHLATIEVTQSKLKGRLDQASTAPQLQALETIRSTGDMTIRTDLSITSIRADANATTSHIQVPDSSRVLDPTPVRKATPVQSRKNTQSQGNDVTLEDVEEIDDEPLPPSPPRARPVRAATHMQHGTHPPEPNLDDEFEMEDEDDFAEGMYTMEGLLTSQPEDSQAIREELGDFVVDEEQSEDDEFVDASEAPMGDDDDASDYDDEPVGVSQSEVHNLKNLSDLSEEEEDEIQHDDDEERRFDSSSDEDEVRQTGSLRNVHQKNAKSITEDSDVEIVNLDDDDEAFDDERELGVTQAEAIEILSDDDFDIPPQLQKALSQQSRGNQLSPPRNRSPTPQRETIPSSPLKDGLDSQFPDTELDELLAHPPVPRENRPWSKEVYGKLSEVFKLSSFRPNQLEAVNATLNGQDVFVLMPTGGGKSLCYQLPAVVGTGKTHGTTIVVSPLISLMQDQVEHLWAKNIRAGMISSKGSAEERRTTFNLFVNGLLDLVYLSPEMISASKQAQNAIAKLYRDQKLARIVVDEAHCVSSWGHDFRPDYTALSFFKDTYPDIPLMALTATANDQVRMDIVHNLKLKAPVFLRQSFNRTNLFYEVIPKKDCMKDIELKIRGKFKGKTGIIYCHSKNACEKTASQLQSVGVRAAYYHAGMDPDDRLTIQKRWQSGDIKVICATIAFGMGIDKPDVRYVIHLTLPRTLEGYYQETGRAGRDGQDSWCFLYYSIADAILLQKMIAKDRDLDREGKEKHQEKLRKVSEYCENLTDCRREQVLRYFSEQFDKKDCMKHCDNCCKSGNTSLTTRDLTEHSIKLTKLVRELEGGKVTLSYCKDIFRGSKANKIVQAGHDQLEHHAAGKELDKNSLDRMAYQLISDKILAEYFLMNGAGFSSSYIKLGPNANMLLSNRTKIVLQFSTPTVSRAPTNNESSSTTASTTTNKAPSRRSTDANHRILNPQSFDEFRLPSTPRIVSAKTHMERTSSGIQAPYITPSRAAPPVAPPSRITLNETRFSSEEEKLKFIDAHQRLKDRQGEVMNRLGFKRSSSVCTPMTLKEMALRLPQSDGEFRKLKGFIDEKQASYFSHFAPVLHQLKREFSGEVAATGTTSKFWNQKQQEENKAIIDTIRASQAAPASPGRTQAKSQSRGSQSKRGAKGPRKRGGYKGRGGKRGGYSQRGGHAKAMPF